MGGLHLQALSLVLGVLGGDLGVHKMHVQNTSVH